jgi:protein O-mannosyl-transferase
MIGPRAWFLLGIAFLVLTAYASGGASYQEFVYFDDGAYLFQNGWTRQGLTWDSVWHNLTAPTGGQYMPVTMISYLPLVSLFGMKAPPQIWFNVALHIANCMLVVWVLHKFTRRFWPGVMVALLLALHPIHVESVAWATERKDVLFMFFGLLTLGVYADYVRTGALWRYLLALVFFVLSLLSKSMLVTMPALLLLLDIWPLGRIPRLCPPAATPADTATQDSLPAKPPSFATLLVEKAPFLILSLGMAIVTLRFTGSTGGVASAQALPYDLRVGLALTSYLMYLKMLFWPVDLAGLYPIPRYFDKSTVLLCLTGILAITGLAGWQFKKRPYLLIGWLWYLGTLVPVSGIMQAGNQSRADRFIYWPFLGIYIALIWLCWDLLKRKAPAQPGDLDGIPRTRLVPAMLAVAGLTAAMWMLTSRQVSFWQDSEVFFNRIIAVTDKNPQAHSALAVYFVDKKKLPEAEDQFLKAVADDPSDPTSLVSLAEIAAQTGRASLALSRIQQAMALPTKPGEALSNAAFLLLQLGQEQTAVTLVTQCLANKPNNPIVQTNAGIIFVATGKTKEEKARGIALLERALETSPGDPGILVNLGSAYGNLGEFDKAEKAFTAAIAAKPDDIRAYAKLGRVFVITRRLPQARQAFQAGLAIDPTDPQCLAGLRQLEQAGSVGR